MAWIKGIEPGEANPLLKLAYWFSKRETGGKLIEPMKIMARHGKLFRAWVHMEMAQQGASKLEGSLKALVEIKVAMMVGCPF